MSGYENCYQCTRSVAGACVGFMATYLPFCPCCCYYPYFKVQSNQVGLKTRFGRYREQCQPGLNYFNPCTEQIVTQNLQTVVVDLPKQKVFTKDNLGVIIDTVCFYRVVDPYRASFVVNDLLSSIVQITYVTLRIVCGQYTLQQLLEQRSKLNQEIQDFVAKSAEEWGTKIQRILVKDMILTPLLQNNLSIVSKTARLCQSRIISAKADLESAKLYRQAADIMDTKAAMQIRFLETIGDMRKKASNKLIILPLSAEQPLDL